MSTAKLTDPLKALLRERDLETLKKKLLKEWGIIRLRTLEGLVEAQGNRLAFLENEVKGLAKFQKELWKRGRYLGKMPF